MSTTATPKDCTYLAAGFDALNRIKRSNALCKALPALEGFNHACNSPDFMDEVDELPIPVRWAGQHDAVGVIRKLVRQKA